jgi:uncharacterized membrane protein YphA (DoxX/SURF4 family)
MAMQPTKAVNALLWTVQVLLAALFLFAGGMKVAAPAAALAQMSPLPAAFLKFIGVAEVTGALGLILPWALRIQPGLTPLAAAGLVIIMVGATVVTVVTGPAAPAAIPAVVGVLAAVVARRRWQHVPARRPSHRPVLQPAN